MSERTMCGGGGSTGKNGENAYEPQIKDAAGQVISAGNGAQHFADQYYNTKINPAVSNATGQATMSQGNLNQIANTDAQGQQDQAAVNQAYGIPAQQNYYTMVSQYSAPEEQERQAQAALGDASVAQANQRQQIQQRFDAAGIRPDSGAAIAAMSDMGVQNAAAGTGAMNQARTAARNLGINLTSGAAGMALNGESTAANMGAAGASAATGASSVANNAVGAVNSGAAIPMQGYSQQAAAAGKNLDAYTSLGNTSINASQKGEAEMFDNLGSLAGFGGSNSIASKASAAIPFL